MLKEKKHNNSLYTYIKNISRVSYCSYSTENHYENILFYILWNIFKKNKDILIQK